MTRTWPALVACAVAIGVLLALIYASRPLDSQVHLAHHQLQNAIANATSSYQSLRGQLGTARRGDDIETLRARLERDGGNVADAARHIDTDSTEYTRYTSALSSILEDSTNIAQQLPRLQHAMAVLREDGPGAVQGLREAGDHAAANSFYALWLKVYEYGLGNEIDPTALHDELAALTQTDTGIGERLAGLSDAMTGVLAAREPLNRAIASVEQARLDEVAMSLATHLQSQHAARVETRNDARKLVSLYSLLLVAGLGFVVYRLHASNRELNAAHQQLHRANSELEDHVQSRTRQVHEAQTDLRQSKVQLVQAEKMSSLGQLVAGISHEINTPLLYLHSNTTLNKEALLRIAEFLELCYQRLSPTRNAGESLEATRARVSGGLKDLRTRLVESEVREELGEVLALIDDNLTGLEELTGLAQGLKDFSRLDHAQVERFELNDGIERTLTIARSMLKDRITVTTQLGDVPPIYCAPSQINQVMLNLVANAAQAIDGEGAISITTTVQDGYAVVRITDTGSGISPDIVGSIREPFFTTKAVGKGTGLGLSIVEEILARHNARMDIESAPGAGSTFSVYLPLEERMQKQQQTDDETRPVLPALAVVPAATDVMPDMADAVDTTEAPDPTDAQDTAQATDTPDATATIQATHMADTQDATQATDTPDATDTIQATDTADTEDATHATNMADAEDATQTPDMADATGTAQAPDTTDAGGTEQAQDTADAEALIQAPEAAAADATTPAIAADPTIANDATADSHETLAEASVER